MRFLVFLTATTLVPALASGAGSLDRLRGVSRFAHETATTGPQHLWVGAAIFAALFGVIGGTAAWVLLRKRS